MPDLLIRDVPPLLKQRIEERARAHSLSLSEEAKLLLEQAINVPEPEQNMADWMRSLVRPEDRGDDLVFEFPRDYPNPPDFE
jgi:plasmid stability protein